MKPNAGKAPLAALLALALVSAAAALLASCPRDSEGKPKGITFRNGALPAPGKNSPKLLFVSGGKLVLMQADGAPKPVSSEGRPLIPVVSFDVNLDTGEVALACGGKAGVVPLQPKATLKPEAEEWHDLREKAGNDAFISLVRLSPDAATLYALTYLAGSVEFGFRLLAVTRRTQEIAEIHFPQELRNCELRDIKFDGSQTPYVLIYDSTTLASLIYRIAGGKAERVFNTEDALNKLDLEEEISVPESMGGIYSVDLADYFVHGDELLLPVYLLVESKPAPESQEDAGLVERTEVWHLSLATKQIVKRQELAHAEGKTQSDFSFAMGQDGLYLARLSFPDAPKPPLETDSAQPIGEGNAETGDKPAAPANARESEQETPAPPDSFAIVKLDIASGKTTELISKALGSDFYGMSIFPEASVCAILLGTEDKLTLVSYSFTSETLQSGIAIDAPNIQYFPNS